MNINVTKKFLEVLERKKVTISYVEVGKSIFFPIGNKIEQYAGIYNARNLITIGAFSASHSTILDPRLIKIGRYSTIENNVKVVDSSTPIHFLTTSTVLYAPSYIQNIDNKYDNNILQYVKPRSWVNVGDDVLIEQDCILITGVKIHTGAIVRAGSVVYEDVPAYSIVQGNPAKIVGMRFDNLMIERLLQSQWWNYNIYDLAYLNVGNVKEFLDKFEKNKQHLLSLDVQLLEWDEMIINSLEPDDSEQRKAYYHSLASHFEQLHDSLMAEDLRQRTL